MDTKIRVVLDTKQAKGELRSLSKEGERTAGRVGERVRRSVVGGLGQGVGFALGATGVSAALNSGAGDVLGETFGAFAGEIERKILGDKGEKARADKSAREQVMQGYLFRAGLDGIPPAAVAQFEQLRKFKATEEAGRTLFETDERFRSVSLDDILPEIAASIGKAIDDGIKALGNKILGAFGGG